MENTETLYLRCASLADPRILLSRYEGAVAALSKINGYRHSHEHMGSQRHVDVSKIEADKFSRHFIVAFGYQTRWMQDHSAGQVMSSTQVVVVLRLC